MHKLPLRILQLNMVDARGGAARVARDIHRIYRSRGIRSWMAVRIKFSSDADVFQIPNDSLRSPWARFWLSVWNKIPSHSKGKSALKFRNILFRVARPRWAWNDWWGLEDLDYPATLDILNLPPEKPDLIHGHNLHLGYFDLRALPWLSHQIPLFLTLHDAWLLTGHCAYPFDCERWLSGCGFCPYLSSYPPVKRDSTMYNWQRKRTIFENSKLYVAAPSRWLLGMAERSILSLGIVESRVVHNGIDLTIFHPSDQSSARRALGLPHSDPILLFTAHWVRINFQKDYSTLRQAIELLADRVGIRKIICIALGDDQPSEHVESAGSIEIHFIPYQDDIKKMPLYYQAADIYVHATRADNLPNTISEALACGKPVIASAVGGIPEQIRGLENAPGILGRYGLDEATGILVPPEDAVSMADAIDFLLSHDLQRLRLGKNAAGDARQRFDLEQQSSVYLKWYEEILDRSNHAASDSK